jgi:glucose/arabinose dehydrogenase
LAKAWGFACVFAMPLGAATAVTVPKVRLSPWGDGFAAPVQVVPSPDEAEIYFVVEQAGRVVRYDRKTRAKSTWIDIADRVVFGGEAGLLGLAFHPKYRENGRYFLAFTAERPDFSQLLVERKRGEAAEKVLLRVPKKWRNHNGSQVLFGPDGHLYLSTGDGGSAGDPQGNGQNTDALLGKILRLDVDGVAGTAAAYRIPEDNPFAHGGGRPEIFAYGLKNAGRFRFDRASGEFWAGDVGQNRREESNVVRRGGNDGWNVMEGELCFAPPKNCRTTGLIAPIHRYGRPEGVSVTGGFVYRGKRFPALVGAYVYGDFGSGTVWALRADGERTCATENAVLLRTTTAIAAFGEERDGELLVVGYDGAIRRLEPP